MKFYTASIVALFSAVSSAVNAYEQGVRGLPKKTNPDDMCEFKGNGFPSGHDYQLIMVGMDKQQAANFNPRPGQDNGRSMFVVYDGKTRINLINSDEETSTCGGKDYKVVDANGSDGTAAFCLPDPFPDCDGNTESACYDFPAEYAIFARVVKGGNNNKMKLCADIDGSQYCYGGTATLPNRKARDVSQQLLTFCLDGTGYGLFDELCDDGDGGYELCDSKPNEIDESYFWDLDSDNLRNAQLRFYKVADLIDANPDCQAMFETRRSGGCGR